MEQMQWRRRFLLLLVCVLLVCHDKCDSVNRFLLLVQKIVLMRYCCQACHRQGYLKPQQAKWSLEPVGELLGIWQMFDLL